MALLRLISHAWLKTMISFNTNGFLGYYELAFHCHSTLYCSSSKFVQTFKVQFESTSAFSLQLFRQNNNSMAGVVRIISITAREYRPLSYVQNATVAYCLVRALQAYSWLGLQLAQPCPIHPAPMDTLSPHVSCHCLNYRPQSNEKFRQTASVQNTHMYNILHRTTNKHVAKSPNVHIQYTVDILLLRA